MFVRIRDLVSAVKLMPLAWAGACLPMAIGGPISLLNNAVSQPQTPSSYAGSTSTGGMVLGALVIVLFAALQIIPYRYWKFYSSKKSSDPEYRVFGELSLNTAFFLGAALYLGSAISIGLIVVLSQWT